MSKTARLVFKVSFIMPRKIVDIVRCQDTLPGWCIKTSNWSKQVVTVYFNAAMDDEVYVKLPDNCGDNKSLVRELRKA